MTPINTWGMNYAVTPNPGINRDHEYIIVAALDNTRVRITTEVSSEDVRVFAFSQLPNMYMWH